MAVSLLVAVQRAFLWRREVVGKGLFRTDQIVDFAGFACLRRRDRFLNRHGYLLDIKWLGQPVEDARLQQTLALNIGRVTGHDHHFDIGPLLR